MHEGAGYRASVRFHSSSTRARSSTGMSASRSTRRWSSATISSSTRRRYPAQRSTVARSKSAVEYVTPPTM
ncbi:hypothetical protein, partial [Longimicrobium sp.]|uniref:hypothetical protein n=1 Tax=Longimicrobium sp. TaxID=2029185 RepID=UPI002E3272E5